MKNYLGKSTIQSTIENWKVRLRTTYNPDFILYQFIDICAIRTRHFALGHDTLGLCPSFMMIHISFLLYCIKMIPSWFTSAYFQYLEDYLSLRLFSLEEEMLWQHSIQREGALQYHFVQWLHDSGWKSFGSRGIGLRLFDHFS